MDRKMIKRAIQRRNERSGREIEGVCGEGANPDLINHNAK